jgi:hypothetical protein
VVGSVNDTGKQFYLYVDGILAANGSFSGTLKDYGNQLRIGSCSYPNNNYNFIANGTIDESRYLIFSSQHLDIEEYRQG